MQTAAQKILTQSRTEQKKKPPFAQRLTSLRQAHPEKQIWVYAGANAWVIPDHLKSEDANSKHPTLFLIAPPNEASNLFDWSMCAGEVVIILQRGAILVESLLELATVLIQAGAKKCIICTDADEYPDLNKFLWVEQGLSIHD